MVCGCVFPCVPSKVVNALIIGTTLAGVETSGETPRRLDDPVQETLEHQEGAASSESQAATHGWRRQGSRFFATLAGALETSRIRYRVISETDIGKLRRMGTTAAYIVHSKLIVVTD